MEIDPATQVLHDKTYDKLNTIKILYTFIKLRNGKEYTYNNNFYNFL